LSTAPCSASLVEELIEQVAALTAASLKHFEQIWALHVPAHRRFDNARRLELKGIAWILRRSDGTVLALEERRGRGERQAVLAGVF
jgi:hypothetical protein